jgi:hypothetical protein
MSKVKIHFTREQITLDLVRRGLIFEDLKLKREKEELYEGRAAIYKSVLA